MKLAGEAKIETLIQALTLEEKASLCSGADFWHTRGIERLGIPAIRMTDGPHGTRTVGSTEGMHAGLPATCFPTASALAATWNTGLVERVGEALAEETRAKGCDILPGPMVNIHRTPLGGRDLESFSEDPYLTGRLAVAYIRGLQRRGVGACVKHFACNNSEYQRMAMSSEVGERALREIYLPAFRAAVQEAGAWTVMCAYNAVNGTAASENRRLLQEILKDEWEFQGFVVSDWFAVYDRAATVDSGLDLEMPGAGPQATADLVEAVQSGRVSEAVLDERVRRILRIVHRAAALARPGPAPASAAAEPAHERLAREAAGEAMVLLKNEGNLLPLAEIRSLAVVGPAAATAIIQGGGSSRVTPYHAVTPLEGLRARAGEAVRVEHEAGCSLDGSLPPLEPAWVTLPDGSGAAGFWAEYYAAPDLSGPPALARAEASIALDAATLPAEVGEADFSARWTGYLTAPAGGTYRFDLTSAGRGRLLLDGRVLVDNWTQPHVAPYARACHGVDTVDLERGGGHTITVEYSRDGGALFGVRAGCQAPGDDGLERAAALAARSDAAVVVVALPDRYESEFYDRPDLELTGEQAALIERVAAANARTAVVVCSGAPVNMSSWAGRVGAVVQGWLAGQELGHALADVLFGDVSPSGKLPDTFPRRLADTPAYTNYPGEHGAVLYGEGVLAGYRYYDYRGIEPLFPFGHGLSYTSFAYSNLHLSGERIGAGDTLAVTVEVANVGPRAGQEVVQLYVHDPAARVVRPPQELKGFRKVRLEPGETTTVRLTLSAQDLAYYDPGHAAWLAEAGAYEVRIGSSSRDIRASAAFTLEVAGGRAVAFPGTRAVLPRFDADSTLAEILSDPRAKAVLGRYVGGLLRDPRPRGIAGYTLRQMAAIPATGFPAELLEAIVADLARIGGGPQ